VVTDVSEEYGAFMFRVKKISNKGSRITGSYIFYTAPIG
jgi:hypothetical protein